MKKTTEMDSLGIDGCQNTDSTLSSKLPFSYGFTLTRIVSSDSTRFRPADQMHSRALPVASLLVAWIGESFRLRGAVEEACGR